MYSVDPDNNKKQVPKQLVFDNPSNIAAFTTDAGIKVVFGLIARAPLFPPSCCVDSPLTDLFCFLSPRFSTFFAIALPPDLAICPPTALAAPPSSANAISYYTPKVPIVVIFSVEIGADGTDGT